MTMDGKVASGQLNRILTFFPRVDSRASMLFAANSAILGVLAARIFGGVVACLCKEISM